MDNANQPVHYEFCVGDCGVNASLAKCLNSVLNVKAVVAAFNQEKALVGAFSVITYLRMELFEALITTRRRIELVK